MSFLRTMSALKGCFCTIQKSCPFALELYGGMKLKCSMPVRTVTYKYGVKRQEKTSERPQLKALTGFDDPHFTDNFKIVIRDPKLFKQGLVNFMHEVKTFYNEEKVRILKGRNPCIDDKHDKIDILFKFEKQEDLNGFSVHTDSSFDAGFSSAALKITQEQTAEFSGHICEDIPKDGNVEATGFATIMCPTQDLSFFRKRRYNWTEYSHLVLKIRGDGRTYLVLLHTPYSYDECKYYASAHPLYTRGGPYWQIVKMPFSHFFFMDKGAIPAGHNDQVRLSNILRMSIMASSFEGSFKLEIDYIGLTYDKWHKTTSPYEVYKK